MVVVRHVLGLFEITGIRLVDGLHHVVDDLMSGIRMLLHLVELFRSKPAGLVEDHVGDNDLADIVERRGCYGILLELLAQLICIDAFFHHLVDDYLDIGSGVLDVHAS